MCLAEQQMTCSHPKTNSRLSPMSREVFLELWVYSVSFHFTQTKLDVYMVRKMFYAFSVSGHMAWYPSTSSCVEVEVTRVVL